jgi:hypothetical protein
MGYFKSTLTPSKWECQYCDNDWRGMFLLLFENGNERVFCSKCVQDCYEEKLKFKIIKELKS